jgi:uncharacterized membrane protein HdeD (DUF308 family)
MAKELSKAEALLKWRKKVFAASMMRIAGGVFIIFGLVILTNMFGIAHALSLTYDNVNTVFGLLLFVIGVFDAMVIPNLILRQPKKKTT